MQLCRATLNRITNWWEWRLTLDRPAVERDGQRSVGRKRGEKEPLWRLSPDGEIHRQRPAPLHLGAHGRTSHVDPLRRPRRSRPPRELQAPIPILPRIGSLTPCMTRAGVPRGEPWRLKEGSPGQGIQGGDGAWRWGNSGGAWDAARTLAMGGAVGFCSALLSQSGMKMRQLDAWTQWTRKRKMLDPPTPKESHFRTTKKNNENCNTTPKVHTKKALRKSTTK
jgi:hypothetical protein